MFTVPFPATVLSRKDLKDMSGKLNNLNRIVKVNPRACLPEAQPVISQLYQYYSYVFQIANFASTEVSRYNMQCSLHQISVLECSLIRIVAEQEDVAIGKKESETGRKAVNLQ